jgi:ribonucleoside-diphosphate reductase alpha chain
MPDRRRLPNRRNAVTEALVIGNVSIVAKIGFDAAGRPAEIFLSGAKDGSGMAAILDDASVVISIALQHGIPAAALAKSIARLPETVDGPAIKPASPIGTALDLIAAHEAADRQMRVLNFRDIREGQARDTRQRAPGRVLRGTET